QNPAAFGMSLEQMTTYGALGMLLIPIMGAADEAQRYIAAQVRQGTLDVDLLKPLGLLYHVFCRSVGQFFVLLITRGIPGFLFAALFLKIALPQGWVATFTFLLSLPLGFMVYFAINL